MFPHFQIFLKQTRRSTKRLVLQLVLLCAVTVFFVVSLNLYSNSMRNLQTVENNYTTIAMAEFYGYVTEDGKLVHPGDETCVGRHLLSVEDYDFSELLALNSVNSIELRTRVGAYIPGHTHVYSLFEDHPFYPSDYVDLTFSGNLIRFVLDADEPLTISLLKGTKYYPFPIRILDQSNQLFVYPEQFALGIHNLLKEEIHWYADDIRRLNRSDVSDAITLYPDVEYAMTIYNAGYFWSKDPETGRYLWREDFGYYDDELSQTVRYHGIGLSLGSFSPHTTRGLGYIPNFGLINTVTEQPEKDRFSLQRYEDIKDDPDWVQYEQITRYDASAFTAVLTNDITLVPAWHKGNMFLHEGRMITEKEYKTGAKVCMISAKMAHQQGWKVGDKLEMHLYRCNDLFDIPQKFGRNDSYNDMPQYTQDCGGFFDEDTYEIVGIFGRQQDEDFGETAEEVFFNPWDSIYIPANSAPNAPTGPVQASLLTIQLENGSINEFQAAVEEMGLTDFQVGEYEIKFSCFDQGYSKIQPGLMEMNRNAVLLLGLSAVLLVVTMVLMSFLFSRQHKHSAGILRMLGGSKKQAFTAILACAAAVVAAGGIFGTILGGALTQSVGASILGDAASAKVALATGVSPTLTALSGLGCMVLFLLLTAIFTGTYIGKEPRALLPKDGT